MANSIISTSHRFRDLTGQQFGRLTVKGFAGRTSYGRIVWRCDCTCGGEVPTVDTASLRSGHTNSCGCLQRERAAEAASKEGKHFLSRTKEYSVWSTMIQRCCNPKNASYGSYGGKGITVCSRWRAFAAFFEDMGERPSDSHSIDRIDNARGYVCGQCDDCHQRGDHEMNCRWITQLEQARNKSSNTFIEHAGERLPLAEWAERTGLTAGCISGRIQRGWSVEKSLTEPVRERYGPTARAVPRAAARIRAILRDLTERLGDTEARRILREAFDSVTGPA